MAEIIQIGSVFNCYLVVGREGSILVDTGSLSAREKILRSARDSHVNLIVLSRDMSFDKYGVDATVMELPGHTQGSIGIIVDGDKLIAGDAMMNMGGSPASKLFEDKDIMLQSMTRIRKMKGAEVYVGHGRKMKIK